MSNVGDEKVLDLALYTKDEQAGIVRKVLDNEGLDPGTRGREAENMMLALPDDSAKELLKGLSAANIRQILTAHTGTASGVAVLLTSEQVVEILTVDPAFWSSLAEGNILSIQEECLQLTFLLLDLDMITLEEAQRRLKAIMRSEAKQYLVFGFIGAIKETGEAFSGIEDLSDFGDSASLQMTRKQVDSLPNYEITDIAAQDLFVLLENINPKTAKQIIKEAMRAPLRATVKKLVDAAAEKLRGKEAEEEKKAEAMFSPLEPAEHGKSGEDG